MMIEKKRVPGLSWVGSPEKHYISELAQKDVKFYKKCIFGHLSIKKGDFVLVSDAESADPDTVDGCDVAQIICLYELKQTGKDPFQAYVQWYSRPKNIPQRYFDSDNICIDFDHEVIEDYRPYDRSISVETIFGMCVVFKGTPEQSASIILKNNKRSLFPEFVCRYKFYKNKTKYKLLPLNEPEESTSKDHDHNSRTPKISATKRTPKSKSSTYSHIMELEFVDVNNQDNIEDKTVTPIKIIKNVIMKVPKSSSASKHKNEINANYLLSPVGKLKISERESKVCRNLSPALENGLNCTTDSDIMNYSIIQSDSLTSNDIKIKLRVSETQSAKKKQHSQREADAETKNYLEDLEVSPQKRRRGSISDYGIQTPGKENIASKSSGTTPKHITETPRRKSILKTHADRLSFGVSTPRRSIQLSNIVEEIILDVQTTPNKQVSNESNKIRKKGNAQSFASKLQSTPSTSEKRSKLPRTKSDLELARERLHVGSIPESLPCRENEFQNIYNFLKGKIQDQCGGCMYISGVPGTGKTATVTSVIQRLKLEAENEKIPEFTFIEINGMRLTEPRQAYVQINLQLTNKTLPWEQAQQLLEKRFFTNAPRRVTTVLLVDELDILCNRRQDVVYNLLDWSTRSQARLVVITIANTMDLPERLLLGKVTSRLGLTRLTFQPYSHKQLQEIVTARLSGYDSFSSDAIQLVARKVAAVSGDARRALDISRRAAEIAEGNKLNKKDSVVTMAHVQNALGEMIASANVQAIKSCSHFEQLFLQAVCAEVTRTGVEETNFMGVFMQLESIAAFSGLSLITPGHALRICSKLGSQRLLICEHSRTDLYQKILLNVSVDDIHFALQVNN